MRPDPARCHFADPTITLTTGPKADAPLSAVYVIFTGAQHIAPRDERPVTVKVPARRCVKAMRHPPARAIHNQREGPRTAGKGDRFGRDGMGRGGVTTTGQRNAKDVLPLTVQPKERIGTVPFARRREVGGIARVRPCQTWQRRRGDQAGEEAAARRHLSPRPPN